MTKIEMVIKGLECWSNMAVKCDGECPYKPNDEREKIVGECDFQALCKDALEVLKAKRWISVADRLPTYAEVKDERVLVLDESGDIFVIGYDECIEGESKFGSWVKDFDPISLGATDSHWVPLEGVTHWMPLPEPPKEDEA